MSTVLESGGRPYRKRRCSDLIVENNVVLAIRGRKYNYDGRASRKYWDLTSVSIPNTITSIRPHVFRFCMCLTSVTFPDTLTSIGDYVFEHCDVGGPLKLPKSLTNVGDWGFAHCSELTSVVIPPTMISISEGAFCNCRELTSLTLPKTLTDIGTKSFIQCINLTSLTLPDTTTRVGKYAFKRCTGLISITLPSTFAMTNIDKYAFDGCSRLKNVVFRPLASQVFLVWALGMSHNRDNWRLTTVKYLCLVLRLTTILAWTNSRQWYTCSPLHDTTRTRICSFTCARAYDHSLIQPHPGTL